MSFMEGLSRERRNEILGVLLLALTAFLFLALVTDDLRGDVNRPFTFGAVENALGIPGSFTAGVLILLLGYASHALYCVTAIWAAMLLQHRPLDRLPIRLLGLAVILVSMAGLCQLHNDADGSKTGGIVGAVIGGFMEPWLGYLGSHIVAAALIVIGVLLSTEFLFFRAFMMLRNGFLYLVAAVHEMKANAQAGLDARRDRIEERRLAEAKAAPEAPAPRKAAKPARTVPEPVEDEADDEAEEDAPSHIEQVIERAREIRIHAPARPAKADPADEANLPFADVPEVVLEDEDEEDEAPADIALLPESGAEDETGDPKGQLDLEGVPARPAPAVNARGGRAERMMPRRKGWLDEEIPADYVYPKRYTRPSTDMLCEAPPHVDIDLRAELEETSALLEDTLMTFGVEARVTDVTRGPSITRFELEPAPGVKVSRFVNLADDLALALKAHRVRVEAPIPGKGRVGIEVPNKDREAVVLRELIESASFRKKSAVLNLALGKDITGECAVADLAKMPHLLVAGATGSGKTVCVKSVLASLLFAKTPEEMQLILIDPKMVELSVFNEIPHLITPVVIDPKKAATALNWLIAEMEERYRLFAHLRVRNIEVYNESVENGEIELPPNEDDAEAETESMNVIRKLPYIVCIIDELADLMIIARSEVEDAIARLAQLARAVGIHLIIATQRPSVDVLTGVIKANFPTRISFQVSSRVDSRCILDEIGAERLIGQGDMLYLPPGQSKPIRIQGAFVSDQEMNDLIAYLKRQAPPQYRDEIEKFGANGSNMEALEDADDDLFDEAVQVVLDTGQASISMVQRKLRVGYTRAARLIDMMEQRGIVGPHVGSKAREILVSSPA